MRTKVSFRWFLMLATMSAFGVGGFVACGGSDPQDVIATDSGPETSVVDTSKPEPEDTGTPDTGPKDSGADSNKILYDAGQPIALDAGDGGTIPCFVPGELEEESNDLEGTANELKPTRCGIAIVSDGGADGGESDFLKFNLKDASTGFYLQFTGKIRMTVRVKGQSYFVSETESPTLPLHKGELYTVEVRSADGQTRTWTVTLFEQP